jgi:EmrB/QacA subfamily drug resistance transporter
MSELTNQSVGAPRPAGGDERAAGRGDSAAGRAFAWSRRHTVALLVLCLAALLDSIDVTVVNVAMPTIKESLRFSESGLAWMVDAYMVPFGGFLLLGGRTGDLIGRRRVLVAGTLTFTVASLGSAFAPTAGVMVATRAVEGVAAAFVVPMTFAMLGSVFPAGPARNRAFGIWGGVTAGAATLGLVLGGVLVSAAGWRWIFLVNLPVGAVVAVAALRVLPADRPRRRDGASRGGEQYGRGLRALGMNTFDFGGALSVTASATMLAYAVAQTGTSGWGSARTVLLLCGSAALAAYFVLHEARIAADPLLPLSLLRNRTVTAANVVSALLSSAMFAVFYATTLYMQQVLHYSALRTGLAYVPFGLSILVAASVAPALVALAGVRAASAAGSLVCVAGLVLLARVSPAGQLLPAVIVPTVVVGLGAGLVLVPTSVAAMSGVAAARHGVASALLNVSRQLGGALGLAVIATVAAGATARAAAGTVAGTAAPRALTAGFHAGFAVSAGLVAAGLIAAVVLLREDGRGERVNMIELTAGQ